MPHVAICLSFSLAGRFQIDVSTIFRQTTKDPVPKPEGCRTLPILKR